MGKLIAGVQMYTLREYCKTVQDTAETLKKVRKMGYKTIQVSGMAEPKDVNELKKLLDDALPKFGQAELIDGKCLNGTEAPEKCDDCVKSCPIEDAVTIENGGLPQFQDHCTGCGLCAAACPVHTAIQIVL